MAFIINVLGTRALSKSSPWAWRIPIVAMQIYPIILFAFITRLPESPRWLMFADKETRAKEALAQIYNDRDAKTIFEKLERAREEERSSPVGFWDMLTPNGSESHASVITVLGQVNQALTG